ncbi:hypothetical protein [Emticicia sp. C21]|uniref:hypothetical protein n=1 Tax=Emticicia sp. C21 TaxID=2302915 RepID=UPI000E35199E|nr:hypothetical protein [Emticicia sp. C21]RFS18170.1 hypothetical protein D0T08_02690 [Emticicia sp. C21]
MERSRPDYLMDKLINNQLSKEELAELLADIGETEMSSEYSIILERYFNQLLSEAYLNKSTVSGQDQ